LMGQPERWASVMSSSKKAVRAAKNRLQYAISDPRVQPVAKRNQLTEDAQKALTDRGSANS
jgi:hypothetical protein